MQDKQSSSNNRVYNDIKEYNPCARLRCSNKGKNLLKIKYVLKSGWFCDKCTIELENSGFILTTA